jgi:predicted amidophosphoribosyltransferase
VKFLYKIYSGYDRFAPKKIPERLLPGKKLELGWSRYIEDVAKGDEVWIFFHGPQKFEKGVYAQGIVTDIDLGAYRVTIRVRRMSVEKPLTDASTSRRIAQAVATRFRQVFLFPQEWNVAPQCNINSVAQSCANRRCENCPTWQALPLIHEDACAAPQQLPDDYEAFAPAYWVLPRRSFYRGATGPQVNRTSELFYRFKTGQEALAFPLALGMFRALRDRGEIDFDCIVPIPLSPAKEQAGEIHRTRILAGELGDLLGCPSREYLSLKTAISKRNLRSAGCTRTQFEKKYYAALQVDEKIKQHSRVLVIDDVSTEGSTLKCACNRIRSVHPSCHLFAATAGQMILKGVVIKASAIAA